MEKKTVTRSGGGKKSGESASKVPSPPYNPHKSVRLPRRIMSLFEWIASKRRLDEKVTSIHQECATLGGFIRATAQLPGPDDTFGDFTGTEIANAISGDIKTAALFCESRGYSIMQVPKEVREQLEASRLLQESMLQTIKTLVEQVARYEDTHGTVLTSEGETNRSSKNRFNSMHQDREQPSEKVTIESIGSSPEIAGRFGSDDTLSL